MHLADVENPLLRQWSCLCISMLWSDFPEAKWMGIRCAAHNRLIDLIYDPVPEVRAAMLHALTTFIGIPDLTDQVAHIEESIGMSVLPMSSDGSVIVRKELLVFFSTFVKRYQNKFLVAAYDELQEEKQALLNKLGLSGSRDAQPSEDGSETTAVKPQPMSRNTIFGAVWKQLLVMSVDPHPDIAQDAGLIVDFMHYCLLDSPMATLTDRLRNEIMDLSSRVDQQSQVRERPNPNRAAPPPPPSAPPKQEGYISLSLRRTASVAASLKNLAFGGPSQGDSLESPALTSPKSRGPATPRGRAPPEWTRPPEVNDQLASPTTYQRAPVPTSRGFERKDPSLVPVIPLMSRFLDWSTEVIPELHHLISAKYLEDIKHILTHAQYFREPQMKPNEPDEPGSSDYNERLWRRSRNEKIISETQPLKGKAGSTRWDNSIALLSNTTQPLKMCFHQFEDHIAVADDRDTIA